MDSGGLKSGSASAEPTPAGAAERLARNLAMLSIGSPGVVSAVRDAGPAFQAGFAVADDGLLTGTLTEATGRRVSLASARRPGEEAERLAGTVDLGSAAAVLVLGFAMGHHVAALLRAAKSSAVVVVYEPDVALLRAVLERQDHTDWLGDPLVRIVTDPDDAVAMTRALEGSEGLVSMGLSIAAHPPSVRRLGDGAERVQQTLISALRSIRTNVVTTLAQSHVTIRNQLMNLDTYARSPGIEPLRGAAAGRPAVVVSAGPSVQRNLHRLAEPGVRDRFVLIATQTMLKPMLELGIRPHFVTALDYHAISGRFYEGLSASDVEGVTLVGEAKANAAIFGAWPGAVRTPADGFLDRLLGDAAPAKGTLRAGSTVAHLAYYLARFLGCDPVLLIGQDLGFTDGQYYGDGASIHGVWGGELNEFCTLETLEWQRIRRMGGRLIRATDHLGRPMFTDEQMHAYRVQFERDFEADLERGLTTIDATEGGVAKSGTTPMPLADAMASHADAPPVRLPDVPTDESAAGSVRAGVDRLREVRAGVWRVGDLSRTAEGVLTEMIEHAGDQPRVNRLIERAHELRDEVKSVTPAWDLVHTLNQRGTLNRAKADRSIYLGDDDAYARQRAQMERDRENLTQLAGSAEMLGEIMDAAIRAHDGRAEKLTRQTPEPRSESAGRAPVVWAAAVVDPDRSGLGASRDLTRPLVNGKTALRLMLERLAAVDGVSGLALATAKRGETARAAGIDPAGGRIGSMDVRIIEVDDEPIRDRSDAIRGARAASQRCWRGGIGGWTYADELVFPDALLAVLGSTGADALLLAGADWGLVDPGLGSAMVARHREAPETNTLVFSQAAVGLSPALVARPVIESIAAKRGDAGSFASVGGILGYLPVRPANDPIAGEACIAVPPAVRDLGQRVTLDTPERIDRYAAAAGDALQPLDGLAERLARLEPARLASPEHLVIELVGLGGEVMPFETARQLVREVAGVRPDAAITLTAERGTRAIADALDHPAVDRLVGAARGAGAGWVHLRTPALAGGDRLVSAAAAGLDAVSLDLVAHRADTYELLAGRDGLDDSRAAIQTLMDWRELREPFDGVRLPWLVARLTRRDAVYEQIETMYDRWLLACGSAVLDPLPSAIEGERIAPLTVPAHAAARLSRTTAVVRADGTLQGRPLRDGLLAAWREGQEAVAEAKPAGAGAAA